MFQQAIKQNLPLRMAITGPSGSGKTYSSLAIASHLGQNIALIDTENGSSLRYADLFNFQVGHLTSHHPNSYVQAIQQAQGFDVLIIDSLTHAWFAELELAEKGGANNYFQWKNVRPLERRLIQTILSFPGHVIATMRSKTLWEVVDNNGKKSPKKVGVGPIQSSGIDYEFDVFGELSSEHSLEITKSRFPGLSDCTFALPGKELAVEIAKSLGAPPPIYKQWKQPEDAIAWATEKLPVCPSKKLCGSSTSWLYLRTGRRLRSGLSTLKLWLCTSKWTSVPGRFAVFWELLLKKTMRKNRSSEALVIEIDNSERLIIDTIPFLIIKFLPIEQNATASRVEGGDKATPRIRDAFFVRNAGLALRNAILWDYQSISSLTR